MNNKEKSEGNAAADAPDTLPICSRGGCWVIETYDFPEERLIVGVAASVDAACAELGRRHGAVVSWPGANDREFMIQCDGADGERRLWSASWSPYWGEARDGS